MRPPGGILGPEQVTGPVTTVEIEEVTEPIQPAPAVHPTGLQQPADQPGQRTTTGIAGPVGRRPKIKKRLPYVGRLRPQNLPGPHVHAVRGGPPLPVLRIVGAAEQPGAQVPDRGLRRGHPLVMVGVVALQHRHRVQQLTRQPLRLGQHLTLHRHQRIRPALVQPGLARLGHVRLGLAQLVQQPLAHAGRRPAAHHGHVLGELPQLTVGGVILPAAPFLHDGDAAGDQPHHRLRVEDRHQPPTSGTSLRKVTRDPARR